MLRPARVYCRPSRALVECAALLVRGGAVWQLVGLITRRSQVQILPPLPFPTATCGQLSATVRNAWPRISHGTRRTEHQPDSRDCGLRRCDYPARGVVRSHAGSVAWLDSAFARHALRALLSTGNHRLPA